MKQNTVHVLSKTVKVRPIKPKSSGTQSDSEKKQLSNGNLSLMWLPHNFTLLSYFLSFPLSVVHTQSVYRQCPEKIRWSQSDTGLSESVSETNMLLTVCCLGPGVRSMRQSFSPPLWSHCSLSEGDILKHTLGSRSFTYSANHCIAVAGLRLWICVSINLIILINTWYCLSSFSRPPCLLSAVPVWISGLPVLSTAGKERSDPQTMSRQACHQAPAPALHLTQTADRTETSR